MLSAPLFRDAERRQHCRRFAFCHFRRPRADIDIFGCFLIDDAAIDAIAASAALRQPIIFAADSQMPLSPFDAAMMLRLRR
jgi:hypothetical protein